MRREPPTIEIGGGADSHVAPRRPPAIAEWARARSLGCQVLAPKGRADLLQARIRQKTANSAKAIFSRSHLLRDLEKRSQDSRTGRRAGDSRAQWSVNGTQSSAPSGNRKAFGMTPTIVTFCPLISTVLPITPTSAWNARFHNRSEITATRIDPFSLGRTVRPNAGRIPPEAKKAPETAAPLRRSTVPPNRTSKS